MSESGERPGPGAKRPESCTHLLWPVCGCEVQRVVTAAAQEPVSQAEEARRVAERYAPARVAAMYPGMTVPAKNSDGTVEMVRPPRTEGADAQVARLVLAALADPRRAESLERGLLAVVYRKSLARYARAAWEVVEPATKLEWGKHHDLVCSILQGLFVDWLRAKRGGRDPRVVNTIFNLPPGTAKSRFMAVFFPTWCWLHEPGMKFMCLSVNEEVALRDARASRDLVRSEWYQQTFSPRWQLKGDQDAISNYGNDAGGERVSKATGAEVVGLRADVIVVDDANNPKRSEESAEREKVNSTWDENIYNRVNDPIRSLRIGVQQRTHQNDWTGHVLERQGTWSPERPNGWLHVVLPAEYESARRCDTPWGGDWRTEEGESLHPKRMTPAFLADERARMQDKYAGQMQQRPSAAEGGRVKRTYWSWCRLPEGVVPRLDAAGVTGKLTWARPIGCDPDPTRPAEPRLVGIAPGGLRMKFDWLVISVDPASKKTERGSRNGILVVAGEGPRRYVLDDRSFRGEAPDTVRVLRELVLLWHPDEILVEAKAAGPPVIAMLREQMASGDLPPVIVTPVETGTQDKGMRLDGCLPTIANGLVHLLDGARWCNDFVEEHALFPNGMNDDRVDALAQVLNHRREVDVVLPTW